MSNLKEDSLIPVENIVISSEEDYLLKLYMTDKASTFTVNIYDGQHFEFYFIKGTTFEQFLEYQDFLPNPRKITSRLIVADTEGQSFASTQDLIQDNGQYTQQSTPK